MNLPTAMGIAAQCWCDPENHQTVMDPPLAESFARRLVELAEIGEARFMEAHGYTTPVVLDAAEMAGFHVAAS